MPLDAWLPMSTFHVDGWRLTPVWRDSADGPVCVGLTLLADPDSDSRLTAEVWAGLPVWDLIAAGPVPERLATAVDAYKQADEQDLPRARAVAAVMGIGEGSASNLILRARKARLLPATRPGVSAA